MINEYTVKKYCNENVAEIQNYTEAVNSKETYDCHHKLEISMNKTRKELISLKLYFKRPSSELIFLKRDDHMRLHALSKGPLIGKKCTNFVFWNNGKITVSSVESPGKDFVKGKLKK